MVSSNSCQGGAGRRIETPPTIEKGSSRVNSGEAAIADVEWGRFRQKTEKI